MNKAFLLLGLVFISLAIFHPILPPIAYQKLSILMASQKIDVPASVSPLPVPFYTHDVNYLYLNPSGLCRFASRQMIIAYWHDQGYISGSVPSQYTLFVEEKHGGFNETMHYESFTSRGLFVVVHFAWKIPYASYTNNLMTWLDGDAEDAIYFAKAYLSNGVPLFGAVAVNAEGWADDEGWPLPNHAIVYTGYNQTGFFYNNPISLNLTKPACGTNKFMSFATFTKGESNHFWWFAAVFPKYYSTILSQKRVKVAGIVGAKVYSPWGSTVMDSEGYVEVTTLKTGSFITVGFQLPQENVAVYGLNGLSISFVYPDTITVNYYDVKWIGIKPLTPHPWEQIPESPVTPPPPDVPIPPSEPLPKPVIVGETTYYYAKPRVYSFPLEFVIGGIFIIFSLIHRRKRH